MRSMNLFRRLLPGFRYTPVLSAGDSLSDMNSCLAQKIVYAHIFTVKHMRYNFKP